MKRVMLLYSLLVAGAAGCSNSSADGAKPGAGGAQGSGTITADGQLSSFTKVASSYWIGHPDQGNPPVIFYMFQSPVLCSDMNTIEWDLAVKGALLEFNLWEVTDAGPILFGSDAGPLLGNSPIRGPRTFTIEKYGGTAFAGYLLGTSNPDANGGTVTLEQLNPSQNVVGSFDVTFPDPDGGTTSAKGSFDAKWCPTAIEP